MFTLTSTVRYSETDEYGNIRLGSLINYLQDCTIGHAEAVGYGQEYLFSVKRAWLLSSWQIVIENYPRLFDEITVETRPYEFSSCIGRRSFEIKNAVGSRLAAVNSEWVYLNTETGRPSRPSDEEKAAYGLDEPVAMDFAPRKLLMPEGMRNLEPLPVRPDDIDSNHHVNNAKYVEIALGLFPDVHTVKELRVEYKRQAHAGDLLYPSVLSKDGTYHISLADGSGKPYTLLEIHTR